MNRLATGAQVSSVDQHFQQGLFVLVVISCGIGICMFVVFLRTVSKILDDFIVDMLLVLLNLFNHLEVVLVVGGHNQRDH